MSPELDSLLCSRYPLIFQQRNWPPERSAMPWGFDCGDGWFLLVDELCASLQAAADVGRMDQPVAAQVKEKFGSLRFRLSGMPQEARPLIGRAQDRSMETCETCGAPGVLRENGYHVTRCDLHAPDPQAVSRVESR